MLIIKRYWVLPALIAVGLAVPTGISNKFLPSTLTSSIFDAESVYIPVISFQTLLLVIYCLFHLNFIRLTSRQLGLTGLLIFITIACAYFSLYPSGFLTYSTTWLIAPFAINIHYKILLSKNIEPFSKTVGLVAYMFLPFYVVDLLISIYVFGWDAFTSYTLASNGHTFVSMLLAIFIQVDLISTSKKFKLLSFENLAFVIYLVGGIISEGRAALVFMLVASMVIHWRKAKIILPLVIFSLAGLIYFNEKIRVIFDAIIVGDFENPVVWSSLISRINFWDVFFEIFKSYPFAGAGGLASNIIKYDHFFPYSVFVDPHNELIFILSGFGVCGLAFICTAIIFSHSLEKRQLRLLSSWNFSVNRSIKYAILLFILFCSLTNANSAKQNIELLICFTILFSVTGSVFSPNITGQQRFSVYFLRRQLSA